MTPLTVLKEIVQAQRQADTLLESADAKRKVLVEALLDPEVDTTEIAPYVTTANRTSKLELPELMSLRGKISELERQLYIDRQENIYAAQVALQEADEYLAAILSTPEIDRLRKEVDSIILANAESAPELTRNLCFKRGGRLAVSALGA